MLSAVDRGMLRKEVIEAFAVALATIKRWLKRRRETEMSRRDPFPAGLP